MVDNIFWLVVEPYPSEKWWSESQLGLWNSQANGKSWNWCSKAPTRQYPSEMKTQDNFGTLIRVSINQTSSNTAGKSTMFDDFPYKKNTSICWDFPSTGCQTTVRFWVVWVVISHISFLSSVNNGSGYPILKSWGNLHGSMTFFLFWPRD